MLTNIRDTVFFLILLFNIFLSSLFTVVGFLFGGILVGISNGIDLQKKAGKYLAYSAKFGKGDDK